jgi:hypothetical protein
MPPNLFAHRKIVKFDNVIIQSRKGIFKSKGFDHRGFSYLTIFISV